MTTSAIPDHRALAPAGPTPLPREIGPVLVACPDARPPAYQAAIGLAQAGALDRFLTGFYYKGHGTASEMARQLLPCQFARIRRTLMRRHERRIPADRVRSAWSFDAALAVENRLAARRPGAREAVARWRTERFDRFVARSQSWGERPSAALLFSDVGSREALPACRRLGIPSILSMVHGDVREEVEVLAREKAEAPDFFPIYLGDGRLDLDALDWLHQRRLRDIAEADHILVPSDHIAGELARHGTPRDRISVIPYAADCKRFRPDPGKTHGDGCTFLFAGGITQRKGIKYLLEAWRRVRRPGWRLQLVGALPSDPGPLAGLLDDVEHLGRVGHADMPGLMAKADVFVFPSLFEGSAVVTYEALACGLPVITTPAAGSVARDGVEGALVGSRDVDGLAAAMARLGSDPALRSRMAVAARLRAEAFDWDRYHAALLDVVARVAVPRR
ncbi:glycosyltransferase family 4 protein [Tundrisphaera sp. TA3]|uniref:glycosyltransferase family 4 protein n=1 Tax=Tundrisphaera sp. TA3 TaxID=3435775 RepID=UPI003EB9AFBA